MQSGDGRKIRSPNGLETNYVKSPSHRGIRMLSSQIDKFKLGKKTPKKIVPQKISEISQPAISKTNLPSLKPTQSSPRSSNKVDFFGVNKVESIAQSDCLGVQCPEDFRPTAPGKSPGAGHSFVTNTEKTSQNKVTQNPNMWNSLAASEDDFRRTTPGRSPGAGHAEEEKRDTNLKTKEMQNFLPSPQTPISFFFDPALISTNDFRPTAPGSSPGAGHSDTDSFQPTTPANNPEAGHSLTSNSDNIISEQGDHPSVAHPHAEGTDEYRPTKPGHSPGAGHAVSNKREPNS
ncbi:hypothetical protein BVRB_6g134380 [Beta vulgaris subsp. vulgaris]|nr:hypothetical protein BVRB_6g134380 [Beta vulgaris subsp. vulgaris]